MRHLHSGLDRRAGDERVQLAPAPGGGLPELRRHPGREGLEGRRRLRGPPGYSGKDFQRPGIQELLEDVRAGKLDAVVTYKIDRVSRSLKDFYEFWETLKAHGVTFVSATQHFDTSDSTGMLMLNILLSFAQFERELTRERTMSKMAGRAEKGLWNGGNVPLGYDDDKPTQTLTPNAAEVPTVRFFFERLIETRSPCTVANEANARGYRSKLRLVRRWDGAEQRIGGKRFDEEDVKAVVRNPVYKGVIRYGGKLYPARHEPIVDAETWEQAKRRSATGARTTTGSATATTTSTCSRASSAAARAGWR